MPAGRGKGKRKAETFGRSRATSTFEAFSGEDFAAAVQTILLSEGRAGGLALGDLHIFEVGNRADGGIDALLRRCPPTQTRLLDDGPRVFQFKRSCPSFSEWLSELSKQEDALGLLRSGASYTLVVGADCLEERVAPLLTRGIKSLVPGWIGKARLWNASTLTEWLREHPATWARVTGQASLLDLCTWAEWSKEARFDETNLRWTPDRKRTEVLSAFAREADGLRLRAWRVKGPPGIGKSRLVLEAIRELGDVLIARRFTPELRLLEDLRVGWIVVDECDDEQHEVLVRLFAKTHVHLISIGRDTALGQQEPGVVWLDALDDDASLKLLPATLPLDLRQVLVKQAGGYPKLLRLLRHAVEETTRPSLAWEGRELRRALVDVLGRESGEGAKALSVWALPSLASESEVKALARGLGIDPIAVGLARQYLDRQGLLGKVTDGQETFFYMTPQLLAEWLTWELWDADVGSVAGALCHASAPLRHNCLRRLATGGGEVRSVLQRIPFSELSQLLDCEMTGEVAGILARTAPTDAFELVRRLLHDGATGEARRSAVRALRTLAWFETSFSRAVAVLSEAVDAQTEGSLVDLFGCFLGTTQADGPTRLSLLRELASGSAVATKRLAIRCAQEACDLEGARMSSGLPAPLEEAWRPRSTVEERDYKTGAVEVLCALVGDPAVQPEALEACAKVVRPLFARGLVGLMSRIVDAWRLSGRPVAPLRRRLAQIEQFDRPRVNPEPEEAQAFLEAQRKLEPTTLSDRIINALEFGRLQSFEILRGLAQELLSARDAEGILSDVVSSSTAGGRTFEFGRLLGQLDGEKRLFGGLAVAAPRATSVALAAGYLDELPPEVTDAALDRWASERAGFVYQLLQELRPSAARLRLVLDLVTRGAVSRTELRQLWFGGWIARQVDDELVRRLLDLAPGGTRFLLASQWSQGGREPSGRRDVFLAAWHHVSIADLDDEMIEHHWLAAAAEILDGDLERALGTALRLASEDAHGQERRPAALQSILCPLVERAPEVVLPRLLQAMSEDTPLASWFARGRVVLLTDEAHDRVVLDWAREHPPAAHLAAAFSSGLDSVAVRLIEAFPRDRMLQERLRHLVSDDGRLFQLGGESALVVGRREALDRIARTTTSPAARRWFATLSSELAQEAKRVKQREQAFFQGALPLPWVASGRSSS